MNADLFPEARRVPTEAEIDDRYTPRAVVLECARIAQVDAFDLDVAACEEAHHAPRWYSRGDNGLVQPWFGNVWCNPPYSDLEPWVARATRELGDPQSKVIATVMLLPANRTEQGWWHRLIEPIRDDSTGFLRSHFIAGRTRFGHPGNPEGVNVGSPPFGCVLLVWRKP